MKKGKLFYNWILSYLFILLIPIIGSFLLLYSVNSILKGEIVHNATAEISLIMGSIDSSFASAQNILLQTSIEENSQYITINQQNEMEISARARVPKLQKALKNFCLLNANVKDLYVYIPECDKIISSCTVAQTGLFYDLNYQKSELKYQEWLTFIENALYFDTILFNKKIIEEGNFSETEFLICYPMKKLSSQSAVIVLALDTAQIAESIKQTNLDYNGILSLRVNDKTVILGSSSENCKFDPSKYETLSFSSDVAAFTIYSYVPKKVLFNKQTHVLRLSGYIIVICFVFGACMNYYFTKKNYMPVEDIIGVISTRLNMQNSVKNENIFIKNVLGTIIDQNNNLHNSMKTQTSALKEMYFLRLLKGKDISTFIAYDMDVFLEINIIDKFYCVLLVDSKIEDSETQVIQLPEGRALGPNVTYFVVDIDGMNAIIVCAEKHDNLHALCEDIAFALQKNTFTVRQSNVTITVSNVYTEMSMLSVAYNEALEAMSYKVLLGEGSIISYQSLDGNNIVGYYFPIASELKLINDISEGDYDQCNRIIQDIYKMNIHSLCLSPQMAHTLMINLYSAILRSYNQISMLYNDTPDNFHELVKPFNECSVLEDSKVLLLDIVRELCCFSAVCKNSKSNQLPEKLTKYIATHLSDINLSVEALATHFKRSRSNINEVFGKYMGTTPANYIKTCRLIKAKELLAKSELSIQQISEQVGYISSAAFIRVFKNEYGITPGRFKETIRHKE